MMNGTGKNNENWFAKRENILRLVELPFKKFNFLILASTTLWILYLSNSMQNEGIANSITDLLAKYWVKPILSRIESGSIPVGIMILFSVLTIIFFIGKGIRRYVYSGKTVAIYATIIFNYTLLRSIDTPFTFSHFANDGLFSAIAYWDVIYLFFIPIVSRIRFEAINNSAKKNEVGAKSHYLNDDPVDNDADIFPERIKIIEKLTDSIKAIQAKSSYAIGISSPWGNGKTTFLRYLLKKLKEKDDQAIFIEFSPWYCKTEADIISLFFDSLSDGLKVYHSSINNHLKKYAKIILSLRKNTFTESIGKALNLFEESKELNTVYKELDKHIGNLNRKIYISIDDLDRLYAKEIIECFKIIRNTANFKNVVFIVAYDAEYVDKALKEALKENHKSYIDKIIQLEYALPEIERSTLVNFIEIKLGQFNIPYEEINRILNPEYIERIEKSNNGLIKTSTLKLEEYFENVRDCIRILNSFSAQYQNLVGEVLPSDLFLVSILKILYPDEALKIYLNMNDYFVENGGLQFKDLDEFKNYVAELNGGSGNKEPRYLIREQNNNEDFFNLFQSIFFNKKQSIRGVSCNDNYEIYYNGVVSENRIKVTDFEEWIKSAENIIDQIDILSLKKTKLNQDRLTNLSIKLSKYLAENKEQAQVQVHALLYLREIQRPNTLSYEAVPVLNNYKEDCIYMLRKIIDSQINFGLHSMASMLHFIKLAYIRRVKKKDYALIVDIDNGLELFQSLSLKLLEKKISKNEIDEDLFDIYYFCVNKKNKNNVFIIDPEANKKMKEFITLKANQILFLKKLEIKNREYDDSNIRVFRPYLDQIFTNEVGNYDGFNKFLKDVEMDNPSNSEIQQICDYWEKYKVSNYKYYHIEQ